MSVGACTSSECKDKRNRYVRQAKSRAAGGAASRDRSFLSSAGALDEGAFVGEVLEDELGDVVFDVDGEVAHDGGLDDLGLVGEPFDESAEHGELGHAGAVTGFVQS